MMTVLERRAWFTLSILALTLLCYAGLQGWFYATTGRFHYAASGAFGLFGLVGFGGFIGRREQQAGKVIMDERDRELNSRATLRAYCLFWGTFVALCVTPLFVHGPQQAVCLPAHQLALLPCFGLVLVESARSLALILQYHRQRGDDEK